MKTVKFNKESACWMGDNKTNLVFLMNSIDYFNRVLEHRGYLYLNQVYETLGINWDPSYDNTCYLKSDEPISFSVESNEDGNMEFLIHIS